MGSRIWGFGALGPRVYGPLPELWPHFAVWAHMEVSQHVGPGRRDLGVYRVEETMGVLYSKYAGINDNCPQFP